jgi:hypothetical protein
MVIQNKALFAYFGNKDKEMNTIMDNLPDMTDIDIIIEPYCGSFSLIRHMILKYPNKKYICVDNDKELITLYKTLQNDKKCDKLINFFETFEVQNKEEYDNFKHMKTTESYLFTHVIYNIRNGLYDPNKRKMNERDISKIREFNVKYKNIDFIYDNAMNIIDIYKNNSRCFMFLDPPFLLTSNFYSKDKDNTIELFLKFLTTINTLDSKILAVCGDNFLLKSYYEHNNINIKFITEIKYMNNNTRKHQNLYVSNY